jgi:hypothetical protein
VTLFSTANQDVAWLNAVNIALGVVVAICLAVLVLGILRDLQLRARKRASASAGLDGEMSRMMGAADDHAFAVPNLGLTMADGGERLDKRKKKSR